MTVRLPVFGKNRFEEVRVREEALKEETKRLLLSPFKLLSANGKTGTSLDFPIGQTCKPTLVCSQVCYAAQPGAPSNWNVSLVKRLRNYEYVLKTPPDLVADRMARELRSIKAYFKKHRGVDQSFLRVNGSGDLFPEAVAALNEFTKYYPTFKLWVVTRNLDMAEKLVPRESLYLQLSVDRSTHYKTVKRSLEMVKANPRVYLSFLRTRPDDNTYGAAIVFNEKKTNGLPYISKTDCPVDADKLELGNEAGVGGTACAKCRKCFSDATLERQREMLQEAA